jgi:hypothetical protein
MWSACGSDCLLMRAISGTEAKSDRVDLYDSGTGRWWTDWLSRGRSYLSATSVGTVAIFAGGQWYKDYGKLLRIVSVCCAKDNF